MSDFHINKEDIEGLSVEEMSQIMKITECRLLHSQIPSWDGSYRYDASLKKRVRNIVWKCKEGCHE